MSDLSDRPLLEIVDLCGGHGAMRVLFDISLRVPRTGTVALLGRNGAGKTTLLQTLLGYLPRTSGTIRFDGAEVRGMGPAKLVRAGVGYVPQDQVVFPSLTVEENLQLGLRALPRDRRGTTDEAYELFPKLAARRGQRAGTMSGGERKMLSVGRALLGRPRLLLLDEPTEGVWHGVVDEILERLRAYARDAAVLLVEQHLELALELADRVAVIERGEIVIEGSPQAVRDDERVLAHLAV